MINKIVDDLYDISKRKDSESTIKAMLAAYLIQCDALHFAECKLCFSFFSKNTKWQKFCSEECKVAYHEAKHNGHKFDPLLFHSKREKDHPLTQRKVGNGILVIQKPKKTF